MKEAIQKAIDGGWKPKYEPEVVEILGKDEELFEWEVDHTNIFLDPLFWQALGKSLGWFHPDGRSVAKYINNDPKHTEYDMWLWYWHRFIDWIAEGKSPDEFFASLISNK